MKPWLLVGFLWVCYLLNHADRQVVYTLFPALQKEFGFSDAVLGLTGALFLWVYGLSSPAAGIFGDRYSKPKLIVASVFIWSAFTALSGLSPNGGFLLACRALLGLSESIFMPVAAALIANAHGPATRSKAIALFASSQMVGVAVGGSLSGYIAEHYHWRAAFWILGATGMLFALPLWLFLRSLPESLRMDQPAAVPISWRAFFDLFRIPMLRVTTFFVAIATFCLFLVYTWLPTFLYDRYHLGLARAGFEASIYPQIGTALGLLLGGAVADAVTVRHPAGRFWIVTTGLFCTVPCLYFIGAAPTLDLTRIAAMLFGFFFGFISSNQVACAYEVVPPEVRASTVGVLNLVGATVSGFAPYLGGLSRKTIGVDKLMGLAAIMLFIAGLAVVYGIYRHFDRDRVVAVAS